MPVSVYLETTIVSYLAARPSRDPVTAVHQEITHLWWRTRRRRYTLYASQIVLDEARAGDADVAARRLEFLAEARPLQVSDDATDLAQELLAAGHVPTRAPIDALHIAVATVHGMNYLLTWNCRHIANAERRTGIIAACGGRGYEAPVICTPEELMGD
jgi:hypothetical protein